MEGEEPEDFERRVPGKCGGAKEVEQGSWFKKKAGGVKIGT